MHEEERYAHEPSQNGLLKRLRELHPDDSMAVQSIHYIFG